MFDDIAALERHLSAHPASPLFARLASLYIDKDRPAQALKLCLQGIRLHPDYPTGLLMIARAQIMLRQYGEARQTLRALLRILPFCPAALRLCERMKELELEYPPYATAAGSVVAQQKITRETERDRRLQWSHQDDILPGIEKFSRARTVPAPADEDAPETAPPAFDLGALAQRLEGARIPSLPEEDERSESTGGDGDVEEINLDLRPVTETLISIYEQQGRWREALDGYARLARRQPERREYYERRMRDVEGRLAKERPQEP